MFGCEWDEGGGQGRGGFGTGAVVGGTAAVTAVDDGGVDEGTEEGETGVMLVLHALFLWSSAMGWVGLGWWSLGAMTSSATLAALTNVTVLEQEMMMYDDGRRWRCRWSSQGEVRDLQDDSDLYDAREQVERTIGGSLTAITDDVHDAHTEENRPERCLDGLEDQVKQWLEALSDEEEDLAEDQGRVDASEYED